MNTVSLYYTEHGPINLSTRELNGFKFPDDVWRRAFRLSVRFARDRWQYLADYYEFKRV